MTTEVATTVLALLTAIVTGAVLVILSFYFGWADHFLPAALIAGAIAMMVILAYLPAQALPGWVRLAYWPVVFLWLRWLRRYCQDQPLPAGQQPPLAEDDLETSDDEIAEYFEFEEVIR
jgi:hypothetical protein